MSGDFGLALALSLLAGAASWWGTRALIAALAARAILDRPNERSSHATPTPRGGGIAVIGAVVSCWAIYAPFSAFDAAPVLVMLAGAVGLALVSWRDDRAGLPVGIRLAAQAVAVGAALWATPGAATAFSPWLPPALGAIALALAWIWFANLYNFMDGIDGLAGGETASIGIGVALVAFVAGDGTLLVFGATAAAAALGFLCWNWQPARIFLGDVGSVPLGFLLGWLLLVVALRGNPAAALLLPAYYLADASLTLLRRLARGERVWQAHRSHFYQRAVAGGLTHAQVVVRVLAANAALAAAAAVAAGAWPGAGQAAAAAVALGVGAAVVAGLLIVLARAAR